MYTILRISLLVGLREKNDKGWKKSQERVWSIDWEGRQMPLVVFSEFSGFEMSEWVIQWSCSINEKAILLGTIHAVHDYFMGVEGNSLLPFDSTVSEWKQNYWVNQGKQYVTVLSCPSVFHRLICTAWERRQVTYSFWHRHGLRHLKLPSQKLTTQALQFRTLNMLN